MQIDLSVPRRMVVRREVTDTVRFRDESHFLYHVKKALRARGNDCIKKLARKDFHLVDDYLYYIRDRKSRYMIWDSSHALRSCAEVFNKTGEVVLSLSGEGLQ